MKKKIISILKIVILSVLLLLVIALAIGDLYVNNFHVVVSGQIYRSRQLSAQQFRAVIAEYQIKSILNLRGENIFSPWYQQEIAMAHALRVQHYNIALNSDTLPTPAQFRKLVTILESAPKPLLIHCESGVDRSGLASAVVLLLKGESLHTARQEVSWDYFVFSHQSTGKQFLRIYCKWLNQHHLMSSKENFLRWLVSYR